MGEWGTASPSPYRTRFWYVKYNMPRSLGSYGLIGCAQELRLAFSTRGTIAGVLRLTAALGGTSLAARWKWIRGEFLGWHRRTGATLAPRYTHGFRCV